MFRTEQGVERLAIFDDFTLDVDGGRSAVINVALGYVGETQLEIIEPVSGEVDLYRTWLPDEFAVRHHHFCHRLDSIAELEAAQAHYEQAGYAIPLAASLGGTRLFYADTTKLLDHYQEYAWVDGESETFMATLPPELTRRRLRERSRSLLRRRQCRSGVGRSELPALVEADHVGEGSAQDRRTIVRWNADEVQVDDSLLSRNVPSACG